MFSITVKSTYSFPLSLSTYPDCLVGLVVKASTSRAAGPGSIPVFASHTRDLQLNWLSCMAPGIIGSVLGLVGHVSVYCD